MSRIFTTSSMVPHFHVSHFQQTVLQMIYFITLIDGVGVRKLFAACHRCRVSLVPLIDFKHVDYSHTKFQLRLQ